MTRRLLVIDRLAVLLVGAGLVTLGLLALDWRYGWLLDYRDRLHTTEAADVLDSSWWPWAYAGGGLVLGLLGLAWLLAHLRRAGPSVERLRASNATGRVEADLRSVASAAAARFAELAPVVGVKGTTTSRRSRTVVEIRGQVDPSADAAAITDAAAACVADLAWAFPAERITCRVVLDAPRRTRAGRSTRVRVR